ncbi:hypothetical protein Ccrd_024562, partial [Cynara cardunculus var. scolymus]
MEPIFRFISKKILFKINYVQTAAVQTAAAAKQQHVKKLSSSKRRRQQSHSTSLPVASDPQVVMFSSKKRSISIGILLIDYMDEMEDDSCKMSFYVNGFNTYWLMVLAADESTRGKVTE